MPTPNPRLTITLEPSTAAQLRRMSELTGNSQSSMISELLSQSAPVFDRLITVLEAAEVAKAAAREEAAEKLERAQGKIEKQLGLMLDWMDDSARPLIDHAEKVKRRARRRTAVDECAARPPAAGGAPATPPSNRGVRSDPKKGKNPATARVSGELLRESYKHANHAKKLDETTVEKGARK